jgi:membrane fusion protein (multidrug efflux system)
VRRRLPIALACAALLLAACRGQPQSEEASGQPVTLSPVLAMDLVDRIEATGQLLAKEHAKIAAEVGGRITEVLIDEGARVEAGAEVLAIDPERRSLEQDSARARVEEARESVREDEREFRRMRDLRARKVASQTQLDQAETDLKLAKSRLLAAEAQLGVAERALRDATVTAPFSGLIARRTVSRGEFVAPGQELFELVSLDPVEVEFRLTEIDSGRVALGQMVGVRVAPFPDETFGATVTFVSPTIDTRTRTLRVKAQLENPEGRLRPGLFARVDLGIAEREGVPMILEEAVLQRADGAVVFRANGENRVERIVIETGVYHGGYVEVVKGLAPGDRIVSRGQARLVEGQLVVPRNPDGTLVSRPVPDPAQAPESQR